MFEHTLLKQVLYNNTNTMTENETNALEETVVEGTEEDYTTEDENTEENDELEILRREKQEAIEAKEKAEKAVVEYKRKLKDSKPKVDNELETFITKNPEFEEHKTDLESYKKKWLSLDEAKIIIENRDPILKNRTVANTWNISQGNYGGNQAEYTKAELADLPMNEYKKVMARYDKWEIKIRI